ncbi:MAG: hypothetical protein Q8K70_07435 [Bacteroidota bacterium]|nr:hypothetical protein [Bacteroidota bacterium]
MTAKQFRMINKVARDPDFNDIADNNYPTVFGTIGTYSKSNEE